MIDVTKLTEAEKEQIFRIKELEYLIEDAKRQIADYMDRYEQDSDEYRILSSITEDEYERFAKIFRYDHDCNVADNDQWENIIDEYLGNAMI